MWVMGGLKVHMVAVAQLAEPWIVDPEVVGSNPIGHPTNILLVYGLGFHGVALPQTGR
jgi:hypothetical protein